jgi:hypothetical protein
MKTAICLFGQPRFFDAEGYRTIRKAVLDPYTPDVFFHTWWSPQDVGKRYDAAPWSGVAGSDDLIVRPGTLKKLLDLYRPAAYEAEPIRIFTPERDYSANTSHSRYAAPNLLAQTYSQQRSAALREAHQAKAGTTYDWVVRCRFDSLLTSFPKLEALEPGFIYVPDVCPNPKLLYDCVSIASGEDDTLLASRHEKLDEYYLRGVTMNGEQMFTAHLAASGLAARVKKVAAVVDHCRSW